MMNQAPSVSNKSQMELQLPPIFQNQASCWQLFIYSCYIAQFCFLHYGDLSLKPICIMPGQILQYQALIKALEPLLPLFEFCIISVKDTQLSVEYFWNGQGHMRILLYYCSAPSSLPAHCCSATDYITMHQQIHQHAAIFSVSYIPLK